MASSKNDDDDRKRFTEFDCPVCTANNPMDDGFYAGDEVLCQYCGVTLQTSMRDGKLRLEEA